MEVLVIGDLHIGKRHKATYGDASIWDNRSLLRLQEIIAKEKPRVLILAGDVFDTSKPTSLDIMNLLLAIMAVEKVYILAGNHDLSMLKEDIAFSKLDNLLNVTVVKPNSIASYENKGISFIMIGWCDTQAKYEEVMQRAIDKATEGDMLVTHANRVSWDNEMDNSFTDDMYEQCCAKELVALSGHEHKSGVAHCFIHLGSVVPHTIAEVGPKYYWYNGLKEIELGDDIIIAREEPDVIDPDKVYYIRPKKEVTTEDLKLEDKDLTIDIMEDFITQASEAGFKEELQLCLEN